MKFTNENIEGEKIELEINDHAHLDDVLQAFQNFLRACGYVIEYNKVLTIEDMDK